MRHHHYHQQLASCQSTASHGRGREDLTSWPPSPACVRDSGATPSEAETRGPTNLSHKSQSLKPSPYKHAGS